MDDERARRRHVTQRRDEADRVPGDLSATTDVSRVRPLLDDGGREEAP